MLLYITIMSYKLKIFLDKKQFENETEYNNTLKLYKDKINTHNYSVKNSMYPDSGFDLFTPKKTLINNKGVTKINMGVIAAMFIINKLDDKQYEIPCGYTMYPRSSISKTPLRISNSVGIIDSGYRGNLIGAFDYYCTPYSTLNDKEQYINKDQRLLQICHPALLPFEVDMVYDVEKDLGKTERGAGGFGSTGL